MDLASFRALLTPYGQEALEAAGALAPREADFLAHFSALSKGYPRELARAALETAILRAEAAAKFPGAGRMYFTRAALEQASGWAVSSYRAGRYRDFSPLLDLGCSIGADTLALAESGPVTGIDRDPLRLRMARANLAALGLGGQAAFIQADLRAALPLRPPARTALFFDPARRRAGRRVFSVEQYIPPLSIVERWLPDCPALGVKISPGVKLDELARYDAEVEFISQRGELKEAVLWFGPLKTARRRATVLPGPHTLALPAEGGGRGGEAPPSLSEPRAFLYEPDPAILRAGLVRELGQALGAAQLDPDIAYLTAGKRAATPFARVWAVEDWLPFGLKRLRAALRERKVGRVTVKKRGSPMQPEELIRALRLKKDEQGERVLFLTHLRGRPIVVICYPEG
jgi:hypothetical protein